VGRRVLACLFCATALPLAVAGRAEAPGRARPPAGAGIGAARLLPALPRVGKGARVGRGARGVRARLRGLPCGRGGATAALAHLELFAHGHVVIVPKGIGVAVGCRYPVWSEDPTGLLRLARGNLTLGDAFAVWGQPLSRSRLARWRAPVRAHVDGRPWRGDPRAIPLHDHAQIVLQAGGPVLPPNARYEFPAA
jgi:hypothetical protein